MKITTEDLTVVHSGVVLASGMNDVVFQLSDNPKFRVVVRVDQSEGSPEISLTPESDDEAILTFTNPNLANFGPIQPISIIHPDLGEYVLNIRINKIGDYETYQVSYTFYTRSGGNER